MVLFFGKKGRFPIYDWYFQPKRNSRSIYECHEMGHKSMKSLKQRLIYECLNNTNREGYYNQYKGRRSERERKYLAKAGLIVFSLLFVLSPHMIDFKGDFPKL